MNGRSAAAIAAGAGAGLLAYGVRGRSSQLFGPSVYKGSNARRAVALTFDDGPSEGTLPLLEILDRYNVSATFFQCGANVRRLVQEARSVAAQGHEIGNHSDTHRPMYLRSPRFILEEFERAQQSILDVTGFRPRLLRAPYGARWFGFSGMQRRLQLTGVMWTVIGRDWRSSPSQIASRVLGSIGNGSIICLHDGRELAFRPDIRSTLEAVRRLVPVLIDRGYQFEAVSGLLQPPG